MSDFRDLFIDTAFNIGCRIARDALWSNGRCSWLGASMEVFDRRWTVVYRTLGADVYGGTAGIGLFMLELFAATREQLFSKVARGALLHAADRAHQLPGAGSASFFTGRIGVGTALIRAGVVLAEEEQLHAGLRMIVDAGGEEPRELDVVSGAAGSIASLISLGKEYHEERLIATALRLGDSIVANAVHSDRGISWKATGVTSTNNLTGLGHGAAGFAWALSELYGLTGQGLYKEVALGTCEYERSWFNAEQRNWPDFRSFDEVVVSETPAPQACGMAWCHGAPGIALTRLRMCQLLPNAAVASDAQIAVDTTHESLRSLAEGGGNYSVCHGNAGNLDVLLLAAQVFNDPELLAEARHLGVRAIESFELRGLKWPSGVNGGGETPCLFLGEAGTGYTFLRLSNPNEVPSITLPGVPAAAKGFDTANNVHASTTYQVRPETADSYSSA